MIVKRDKTRMGMNWNAYDLIDCFVIFFKNLTRTSRLERSRNPDSSGNQDYLPLRHKVTKEIFIMFFLAF